MSNVFIYSLSIIFNLKKNIIWCKKKELNFNRLLDSGAKNLRGEGNFCSASSGRFNPPPGWNPEYAPDCIFTLYICTVQRLLYSAHVTLYTVNYIKVAEKAIVYFERAALMQPDEVKWHLMIGKHGPIFNCYQQLTVSFNFS